MKLHISQIFMTHFLSISKFTQHYLFQAARMLSTTFPSPKQEGLYYRYVQETAVKSLPCIMTGLVMDKIWDNCAVVFSK